MSGENEEKKKPKFNLVLYEDTNMFCRKDGDELFLTVKNEGDEDFPDPVKDPTTGKWKGVLRIRLTYPGFGSSEDNKKDSWQVRELPGIKIDEAREISFAAPLPNCFNPDAEFTVIIDKGGPYHFEIHDACFFDYKNN